MKVAESLRLKENETVSDQRSPLMGNQNEKGHYTPPLSEDAVRLAATFKASRAATSNIILFTGIAALEGVSTVAAQVALALAQVESRPVLLVDANLRSPSVHATFHIQRGPGLVEVIEQSTSLTKGIHLLQGSALSILPVGAVSKEALEVFPAPECAVLMERLREEFCFVIVDSSPLLQFIDTTLLVPYADSVVMVIAAGARRQPEIVEARRQLARLKAKTVGLVLCEKPGRRFR